MKCLILHWTFFFLKKMFFITLSSFNFSFTRERAFLYLREGNLSLLYRFCLCCARVLLFPGFITNKQINNSVIEKWKKKKALL